jgi:hypothetical protein
MLDEKIEPIDYFMKHISNKKK